MPLVNKRIPGIPVAYTKRLTEAIKDDKSVVNLGRGDSEFQTPMPIIDYLRNILPDAGENTNDINSTIGKWTHYEKEKGAKRLREAIARKYKRESGLEVKPEHVLITQGGMNAIFTSFLAITNPGDEILIPDPCYVAYDPISNYLISGIKGVRIKLKEENNFILTIEQLEAARTKNTKALILTSPLNPTGTLYGKDDLKKIMEWGIKNDIFIIHDENHEKEVYDGLKHFPIKLWDAKGEHSLLLNSFSRLGMGGWRLGWIIGPQKVMEAAGLAHSYINMTCNTFVQEAGVYTLDNYEKLGFDKFFKGYQEKRDYLVPELNKLKGFRCLVPSSTCYAFPNIRKFFDSYRGKILSRVKEAIDQRIKEMPEREASLRQDLELVEKSISFAVHKFLLHEARVGVIPGLAYGPGSDDYVRLSFSVKKEAIQEAVRRLKKMYEVL